MGYFTCKKPFFLVLAFAGLAAIEALAAGHATDDGSSSAAVIGGCSSLISMKPVIKPFIDPLGLNDKDVSRISQVLGNFTEKERKEIIPFLRYLPSRQINPEYEPAAVIELLAGIPSERRSVLLNDTILNIMFPVVSGPPSFLRSVRTIRSPARLYGNCWGESMPYLIREYWPLNELGSISYGSPLYEIVSGALFVATVNGDKNTYDLYNLACVIAKIPSPWMDMLQGWFKAILSPGMLAADRLKMVAGLVELPPTELRFSQVYTLNLITPGMSVDEQLAVINASYAIPERIRNTILSQMMPGLITVEMSGFERASLLTEMREVFPEIEVEGIDGSRAFARMVLPVLKLTRANDRRGVIHAYEERFRALSSPGQRASCQIAHDFANIIDSPTGRKTLWTAGFIANVASCLQYVKIGEHSEILDLLQPIIRVKVGEEDHRFLAATILSLATAGSDRARRAEQILLDRG